MQLDESPQDPFEPVAIVGVGAILPDSHNAETFWQNVINAKVSFENVPEERWAVSDHWQEGGPKISLKERRILELVHSKDLNLIGNAGGSLQVHYLRLILVNSGQLQYLQRH